jgi:hypothetical protein
MDEQNSSTLMAVTLGEARRHRLFFLFATGRMAIEPNFLPIVEKNLLTPDGILGSDFNRRYPR